MQKQTFWRDPFINSSKKKNIQTVKTPPTPTTNNKKIVK